MYRSGNIKVAKGDPNFARRGPSRPGLTQSSFARVRDGRNRRPSRSFISKNTRTGLGRGISRATPLLVTTVQLPDATLGVFWADGRPRLSLFVSEFNFQPSIRGPRLHLLRYADCGSIAGALAERPIIASHRRHR